MATESWWAVEVDVPHVGETISYIQASSKQLAGETFAGSTVIGGPYSTEAAAEKAYPQGSTVGGTPTVASKTGPPTSSDAPISLSWSLVFGSFSGWFVRGVKVIIGGILMVLAISRLTGTSNKVTELASNIKVVPV